MPHSVDDEHAPTQLPTSAPIQNDAQEPSITQQVTDDDDDDVIPPKVVVFHSLGDELLDTFESLSNDFNKLDRLGKSRMLPYLLQWLTKRNVKYYISVVGVESMYTENQATVIDRFNLLPENKRRSMFPKVAAYFVLQDIDYRVIEDDNWQSPFIQRVAS